MVTNSTTGNMAVVLFYTSMPMWKVLVIAGIFFIALALFYFIKLAYYLINSYEFTDYGYGVLTGKAIFLIIGTLLLWFGFKMKKTQKKNS